ncbi:uncharacterized protein LOC135488737 isoform X2 [Lineus longissimus]|uniref:uncharacterized protein LOC135488737 isoform X2 n=2 Tax=Lineus longissimus TaxID=88925 RepID=UPI002B4D93D5
MLASKPPVPGPGQRGRTGRRSSLQPGAVLMKFRRSRSVCDGMMNAPIPIVINGKVAKKVEFDVCVILPNGERKRMTGSNGMRINDLVDEVIMDFHLSQYQVCSTEPRQILNPDADANLVQNCEIIVEDLSEDLADLKATYDERYRLVLELWKSENKFRELIKSVFDVYADPLRKFSSINPEDHRTLFSGLEPILSMSTLLCTKLEDTIKVWEESSSTVGNLFSKQFWHSFDEYYTRYPFVKLLLRKKRDTDEEFVQFCKLRRGAARHSLDSLLLLPVQRIPEYDKYLQELHDETSTTHPDYEELSKTAQRVSNMVKEREQEMSNAENEYKVDNVQDRFPHDDLQLNEKEKSNQRYRALQTRRRSAPSAVLIKNVGVKNRGAPNINSRPLPFVLDELPSRPHNTNRTYLLEGPVQLTAGIQPQDRYLFLFNDILLIAKKKSATTFKLKTRVRVCELWLTKSFLEDVTEASSSACPPERSFVIGWPTTNMVATFGTADLKDLWLSKLTNQISEEKSREVPKMVSLRILNKEMPGYASSKNIPVMNTEEVNDVIKTCLEQFEISDAKPEDYQIWVRSGKEGTMSPSAYPLFGHEHPYSIKMSHVRDAAKVSGHVILPQDTELGSDSVSPEHQCQFIIKHKSKLQLLNISNKKNKKSTIANLFRRSASRRDMLDFDIVDATMQGKLFGQRLADICEDDVFPKPVMDLLTRLFHEGPLATGILRKSANKRLCENLKALFDEEKEYNIDDWSILVIGDTLKLFFREMPDSIIGGDLYEKFVATCDISNQEERVDEVRRMIESLPKCNQYLLRHFFCVLCRIDENKKENNMDAYNLAVCVRPSILRNPSPGLDCQDPMFQEQMKKETKCVQFVIENFVELFGEESLKMFGEPKLTMRQDSGTDSDSMHSILSMQESTGGLRRDDSSLDSLDRELYSTEMDSSPQLAKSHLSPTNLSRDSGLTLSDSQLYEESGESENSNNSGGRADLSREELLLPVPPPRNKRRRGSEPQTNLDAARVLARMCAVPGNGALASGMGQEKARGSLCHSMSGDVFRTIKHGGQLQAKKLSIESLRSVEENSESELNPDFQRFQSSGDIGVLRKSLSGAKLFFDEDMVMTHGPGEAVPTVAHGGLTVSCDNRRSSTEYSSQDSEPSTPGSPNLYRRVWSADTASKPGMLSASYGGSSHQYQNTLNPNYVPQSNKASGSRLNAPMQSISHSAPSTPNESSPSSSPRGSFSKYLSKDSAGSSPRASSTDLLSNDSDGDCAPPLPPKPPTLSLTNAPVTKAGKYSDTVGCGSPPPDVILRNQIYKGQQGPEQIFDFDSPKLRGFDSTRLAHDVISSCSSDDDDRPTRSFTSSLSSLNSGGSQEKTDKVGTTVSTSVTRKNCLQKAMFVEKSSSDTNVLKQFHKSSSGALGRRDNGQIRPERPPSYQEAIHRKILLKSGNGTTQAVTYTDKDIVEQSANSANARKLYEESLKKYNQGIEGSSSSASSKCGMESRPGLPKHSVGSAIQEEPSTPPKSPATVKRSRSDTDKIKELKSHFQNAMFYSPVGKERKDAVKDNVKTKHEVLRRQSSGSGNPSMHLSDCTPVKVDKNAATVQYYKALVKTAPEPNTMRRNPPPYRHPPPIQSLATSSGSKVKDDDDKPRLRRQGSGPKPAVDLDTLVCTEESLV